jgi:hypothetical protein
MSKLHYFLNSWDSEAKLNLNGKVNEFFKLIISIFELNRFQDSLCLRLAKKAFYHTFGWAAGMS